MLAVFAVPREKQKQTKKKQKLVGFFTLKDQGIAPIIGGDGMQLTLNVTPQGKYQTGSNEIQLVQLNRQTLAQSTPS